MIFIRRLALPVRKGLVGTLFVVGAVLLLILITFLEPLRTKQHQSEGKQFHVVVN